MRILITLVLPLLLFGCASVQPYRFTNYTLDSQALTALRENRIAVLPLEGDDGGRIADEFSIQLGRLGQFSIVERNRIRELWQEQDLDTLYRFDQKSAATVGKMLGAHAVVIGRVLDYRAGRVGANLRLVAVETGEIIWQGSDILQGSDRRLQALVADRQDKSRLATDRDYLAMWLCRLLSQSLLH